MLALAKKQRPSAIMEIDDQFLAFCFDEACDYILGRVKQGDQPVYRTKAKSFHDFYKQFD